MASGLIPYQTWVYQWVSVYVHTQVVRWDAQKNWPSVYLHRYYCCCSNALSMLLQQQGFAEYIIVTTKWKPGLALRKFWQLKRLKAAIIFFITTIAQMIMCNVKPCSDNPTENYHLSALLSARQRLWTSFSAPFFRIPRISGKNTPEHKVWQVNTGPRFFQWAEAQPQMDANVALCWLDV